MGLLSNTLRMGASQPSADTDSDYQIERSLRFEEGDSANLTKTFKGTGNRRTWTY